MSEVVSRPTIVVLDGLQDPGNVGAILRACLGFDASVLLIESAEVTNPKTVRASAGALLYVPWLVVARSQGLDTILRCQRPIYRLELRAGAIEPRSIDKSPRVLLVGNEGQGIKLEVQGRSVAIRHLPKLESLNVAVATSLVLYELWQVSK